MSEQNTSYERATPKTEVKTQFNQFITALDMAQLKKIAAGLRRIDFDKPKPKYMKECDDFIRNEVPEIKSKVKMHWVNDVIDSRISTIAYFASRNWGLPKELSKEFEKHAEYIEKLSNTWK